MKNFDLVTVKRVNNTSKVSMSYHETLEQARTRRLELIRELVDKHGLDQDSGDYESDIVELSMRPCNSLSLTSWDSVYTVTLQIWKRGS